MTDNVFDFGAWVNGTNKAPTPNPAPAAAIDFTGDTIDPYTQAAIDRECAKLAGMAPNSGRNHQLNTSAFNLASLVAAGKVERQQVTDRLVAAARACGLDESEILPTIESGFRGSAQKVGARQVPELEDVAPAFTMDPNECSALCEDGRPRLAMRLLNRTALRDLPDPEPLIDDTIDRGTVGLLYGAWGTFKTFTAIDWAASIATGRPWQGRPTHRTKVLYVAAEGAFGLKARINAWEVGWNTTIDDDDLFVLPDPVNLGRPTEVAELAALINWGAFGLIVFDTLARCTVGLEENSAQDVGLVIDRLYKLRDATPGGRGSILAVHHAGKAGTLRGSSAYEAGVDLVYRTTREDPHIALTREKRKDGPEADHHLLRFDAIEGTGSGCLKKASEYSHGGVGMGDTHAHLIATFISHFSETGATSTQLRAVAGLADSTFYRTRDKLVKCGDLVNTGSDKRPFYVLGKQT
ncbi:AAA family ATPase [Mycobacteroides abscessus subsp. bolletii]|uniref:AAA family ATPase n=1 Tax=Mycobacteroides abscessus TaxID=36809 RepID=UPI00266BA746|nr:AAA family ATPase [Mycobacteroides abscessus]MDO3126537.1 AAA family ATPase [Mycobacteroides abscessus subsp. bolletii]